MWVSKPKFISSQETHNILQINEINQYLPTLETLHAQLQEAARRTDYLCVENLDILIILAVGKVLFSCLWIYLFPLFLT